MKLNPMMTSPPPAAADAESRTGEINDHGFFDVFTARLAQEDGNDPASESEPSMQPEPTQDSLQIIRRIERLLDAFDDYRRQLAGNLAPVTKLQAYAGAMQTECRCLQAGLPQTEGGEVLGAILADTSRSLAGEISRLSRGEYSLRTMVVKEAVH